MGSFHINDSIKMISREIQSLCITDTKVNSELAVNLTVVINGFGILIDGSVSFWFVIALDKGRAASMPTTDLKNILFSQFPAAGHMMVQLDGRSVGFILRFQLHRLTFRRPIAII